VDSMKKQIAATNTTAPSLTSKDSLLPSNNTNIPIASNQSSGLSSLLNYTKPPDQKKEEPQKPMFSGLLQGNQSLTQGNQSSLLGGLFGNQNTSATNSTLFNANLLTTKTEQPKKEEPKPAAPKSENPTSLVQSPFNVAGTKPGSLLGNLGLFQNPQGSSNAALNFLLTKKDDATENKSSLMNQSSTIFTRPESDNKVGSSISGFKPPMSSGMSNLALFANKPQTTEGDQSSSVSANPFFAGLTAPKDSSKTSLFGPLTTGQQPSSQATQGSLFAGFSNGQKPDLFKTQTASNAPLATLFQNKNDNTNSGATNKNVNLFGNLASLSSQQQS